MKLRGMMVLFSNLFLRMIQSIYLYLQTLVVPSQVDGDDYIHTQEPPCEECEKEVNKHVLYDAIWLASTNDIDENVKSFFA